MRPSIRGEGEPIERLRRNRVPPARRLYEGVGSVKKLSSSELIGKRCGYSTLATAASAPVFRMSYTTAERPTLRLPADRCATSSSLMVMKCALMSEKFPLMYRATFGLRCEDDGTVT